MKQPVLVPMRDGRHWRLAEDFERKVRGQRWVVEKGFMTNFASVPRFFWRIFPPWDKYGPASIIHDYIYGNPVIQVSRKDADTIMYEIMKQDGVSAWKRMLIYYTLRVFGFPNYSKRISRIKKS